jgi:DNA-binding SARP family transcriptional activator
MDHLSEAAMLNVTLFGGASFSINGTLVGSDLGPAGRLLACYLFQFAGRVHRRERLADLFWGDIDPDKAKSALNTAVWRIRKILDLGSKGTARHLITVGDDVILEHSQSVHVDTHQLESASRRALNRPKGYALTDGDLQDIIDAVHRYTGPFLDGHDDDWVLQERERLHCLFVRSTFELMRAAIRQGQYESALDFGRRILAMDSLRESVQRDVMLLLVLNGQRVEAIRNYQRLVKLLKFELDIEPMPETKQLHSDILSGKIFNDLHKSVFTQFGIQKA